MALTPATTIDAAKLAVRVGGKPTDPEVQRCLDLAVAELDRATVAAFRAIPQATMDELVLSVGQAMWDRRKTSSQGGGQITVEGTQQLPRTPRDPLASVRSILAQYVVEL